ncbi:alpha/beta hydrolase [Micromonospora sp. 067-2]|uniref:alpha/beta hydrolase n=1 Tax=Micromonospora sp. 067-2 TaxID=2789270 RepID=UPI00397E02EE
MRRRRWFALVGAIGLVGALGTMLPAASSDKKAGSTASLTWAACPADVVITVPVQVQCAKVPVPLDYRKPDGTQIELLISRIASPKPDKRRGVLLLNPGGPGGTGLNQGAFLISRGMPTSVSDAYDLIGMDTRGVGHSSSVGCGLTPGEAYWGNVPPYPADDAAVLERTKIVKEVAERCAANDKDGRLRHVTTANMARDLDRIRIALGEKKASFYGASYGTALGSAYTSLFPDTTDRVVLDSNLGDTYLSQSGMRQYGVGFEETFGDFANWAAARHDVYGLGRTPAQVRETYFRVAERLDKTPLPTGGDGAQFRFLTFFGLYSQNSYGTTARYWQEFMNPAAAPAPTAPETMAPTAPATTTPSAPATPAPTSPHDNALSVFLAVTCNDFDWPEDVETYRRAVAEDRKRLPMFGAAGANITPCAYWKYEPSEPPVKINDEGPANVLILQNRRDPVTPLVGGKLLREKFEKRSALVTVDASGHGVYFTGDNACALGITTKYLVEGEFPAKDVTCARN